GAVFYAMERRRGIVVRTDEPPQLASDSARRRVSEAVIDTLADLHAIDVAAHGLSTLGKPAGFVARQVRGWSERWLRSKTAPAAEMDALSEWLCNRLPAGSMPTAGVYGDIKPRSIEIHVQP